MGLLVTAGFIGFITFEPEVVRASKTWYVGSGPNNDTTSIQDAITNYANPGDTIFVHSGVYIEQILIDKTINLIGEDKNTTIINGGGGNVVWISSANWVNITGFTITTGNRGIYITSSSFIKIQENEINNNVGGISSWDSSNNSFINNIVHDQKKSGGLGGEGFFFSYSGTPYSDNKIIGNIVYNNEADGIHLESPGGPPPYFWNNSITNNTVYNNTLNGIFIVTGENNFVIDNIVHHNGLGSVNLRGGIDIESSNDNSIKGNLVHNNQHGIILGFVAGGLYSNNNAIIKNIVYNNDIGISLEDASENLFIDNSIADNNYSLQMSSQSNNNDFINCGLSNATVSNVYMETSGINNFINCTITNSSTNVHMEQKCGYNNFINCSLSNAVLEDYNLTEDSHAILLNTSFDKNRTYYGDALSTLTVKWFMHVNVIYYNGTPVSDADVWVNDTYGTEIFNGQTDSNGWKEWVVVTEYIEQDMNGDTMGERTYYTPHNVTAADGILWGKTHPDPFMNISKTVTVILGNYTSLNLFPGWNLISLPRIQTYTDINTVLNSIEGDYDTVQWFNITDKQDQWKHHHISKPHELNDLEDINHIMGFWIHVTNPSGTTLLVYGDVFSSPEDIPFYTGWNQVGYPSLTNRNSTAALNNLTFGVEVDSIWTFDGATQTWAEVGPGDDFKLGRGYWVHAAQECLWEVVL